MRQVDAFSPQWDPVDEGTVRHFNFRKRGEGLYPGVEVGEVPWQMDLRWADGGWTEIVGLRVGDAPSFDFGDGANPRQDTPPRRAGTDLPLIPPGVLTKVAADAERHRQTQDATQRLAMIWRDIHNGALQQGDAPRRLGGRAFDMLRNKDGVHDDARLAASLYRLFVEVGSRHPTEDVAQATAVSRATAARRLKQARDAGMLGEARIGASGEFDTRRGK